MGQSEAKKRLLQITQRRARIEGFEERIRWLRAKAQMAGARYVERTGRGTTKESAQERFITHVIDAEAGLRRRIEEEIEAEREVEAAIDRLEDSNQRDVLRLRYINGWPVRKVADKLHFSERQIIRYTMAGIEALRFEEGEAGQGSRGATAPGGAACP